MEYNYQCNNRCSKQTLPRQRRFIKTEPKTALSFPAGQLAPPCLYFFRTPRVRTHFVVFCLESLFRLKGLKNKGRSIASAMLLPLSVKRPNTRAKKKNVFVWETHSALFLPPKSGGNKVRPHTSGGLCENKTPWCACTWAPGKTPLGFPCFFRVISLFGPGIPPTARPIPPFLRCSDSRQSGRGRLHASAGYPGNRYPS